KKRARKNKKGATPSQSNVVLFPHLNEINDSLADNLICLFIGINPGVQTAITGHAYAHKSNWFWKLLHSSTCVDRLLPPHYDNHLPRLFSLGCTNLVPRPTANQTQISEQEKRDGVPVLVNKIVRHRPESVCFVGKDIWKTFHKVYFGAAMDEKAFEFGWQRAPATGKLEEVDEDDGWSGARIFVSFSTSGLVSFSPEFKKLTWSKLGEFVNERRVARG
ncbi:uracil-DNA glycosylase-like protein, partial [Chytriomyces sp. MP71]